MFHIENNRIHGKFHQSLVCEKVVVANPAVQNESAGRRDLTKSRNFVKMMVIFPSSFFPTRPKALMTHETVRTYKSNGSLLLGFMCVIILKHGIR